MIKENRLFNLIINLALLVFVFMLLYQIAGQLYFQNYWKTLGNGIALFAGKSIVEDLGLLSWYYVATILLAFLSLIALIANLFPRLNKKRFFYILVIFLILALLLLFIPNSIPSILAFFIQIVTFLSNYVSLPGGVVAKVIYCLINLVLWVYIIKLINKFIHS